jgi:hypothetical protein
VGKPCTYKDPQEQDRPVETGRVGCEL